MNNHVELTIRELTKQIADCQDAIRVLSRLTPLTDPVPVPAPEANPVLPRTEPCPQLPKPRNSPVRMVKLKASRPAVKKQTGKLGARILEAIGSVSGAVNQATAHAALADKSVTVAQVGAMLSYFAQVKKLQVVERGRPGHPATYCWPDQKAPAPKVASTVEGAKAGLREQLDKHLKKRDEARAHGWDKIEDVEQRAIDALEKQIQGS